MEPGQRRSIGGAPRDGAEKIQHGIPGVRSREVRPESQARPRVEERLRRQHKARARGSDAILGPARVLTGEHRLERGDDAELREARAIDGVNDGCVLDPKAEPPRIRSRGLESVESAAHGAVADGVRVYLKSLRRRRPDQIVKLVVTHRLEAPLRGCVGVGLEELGAARPESAVENHFEASYREPTGSEPDLRPTREGLGEELPAPVRHRVDADRKLVLGEKLLVKIESLSVREI